MDSLYFRRTIPLFIVHGPHGSASQPGGHHGDSVLKTRVANLGSGPRPVARAPAPGEGRAWPRAAVRADSKMLIFARFYKGLYCNRGCNINVDFPMVFHGFRDIANRAA